MKYTERLSPENSSTPETARCKRTCRKKIANLEACLTEGGLSVSCMRCDEFHVETGRFEKKS